MRNGLAFALLALAGVVRAAVEPLDDRPINEIPAGPVLFSGPDGAFVIYDSTANSRKEPVPAVD
ncbi:MAG: hypothetical protein O7A03_11770 [Alphaproteobacteria bacterium]|nr:hypothetical protein [Alphaproteobacteria bacterium]